jgi:hypothetical protein
MPSSFRQRFLLEAGEHPYAWVSELGLPKDLVSAVLRGGEDYRPIRRTLKRLAEATGKSAEWWLTGKEVEQVPNAVARDAPVAIRGHIASGMKADPELLALAVRALEEWAAENGVVIDPARKGAIISVLYDYLEKGAGSGEVANLLKLVG